MVVKKLFIGAIFVLALMHIVFLKLSLLKIIAISVRSLVEKVLVILIVPIMLVLSSIGTSLHPIHWLIVFVAIFIKILLILVVILPIGMTPIPVGKALVRTVQIAVRVVETTGVAAHVEELTASERQHTLVHARMPSSLMLEHIALIIGFIVAVRASEQFLFVFEVLILFGFEEGANLAELDVVQIESVHITVRDRVSFLMLALQVDHTIAPVLVDRVAEHATERLATQVVFDVEQVLGIVAVRVEGAVRALVGLSGLCGAGGGLWSDHHCGSSLGRIGNASSLNLVEVAMRQLALLSLGRRLVDVVAARLFQLFVVFAGPVCLVGIESTVWVMLLDLMVHLHLAFKCQFRNVFYKKKLNI